ncbi:hypothetical protein BD560DRAFT_336184, partial [Blakeslea trispora]
QPNAQAATEPFSSSNVDMVTEQPQDHPLHSLEVRPSFNWTPSPFLSEALGLNSPLFTSTSLTDDEKSSIVERYPPIDKVQYQPPSTLPIAAKNMSKYQSKQDMALKRLQYVVSGVSRPLNVLELEISKASDDTHVQQYLYMLANCRTLLLNVSAQVNDMRNNLAFQSVNPSFQSATSSSQHYTMTPTQFQSALAEQTTTAQTIQNANKF